MKEVNFKIHELDGIKLRKTKSDFQIYTLALPFGSERQHLRRLPLVCRAWLETQLGMLIFVYSAYKNLKDIHLDHTPCCQWPCR